MRVVLDSNVLVSALVGHSLPRRLLFQLLKGHVILSSIQMLAELEEVLLRKKFELTRGQIEEYLKLVINGTHLINVTVCPEVVLEDPDDDIILATASEGDADYIVTGDKHLLRLEKHQMTKIVTVKEMLELVNYPPLKR
ncbi:MAG: putative toxin-antitoxin system toxin component, PIN family [Candidatus Bathyarchaeota archaeon]|jgi:putative PIN family toxin of toxin-antitoxin system|nr:putative toxin-antitoxin system toxin component, PIN family [Candidatus Bathyarchaeota archaeon]